MAEQSDKVTLLTGLPVFRGLAPPEAQEIIGLIKEVKVAKGDLLCREGDAGDSLFLLLSGQVEVLKKTAQGDEQRLAVVSAPSVIGEMTLIDGAARSATVRAVTEADVGRIETADFNRLRYNWSKAASKVVRNLATMLCERLRETTDRVNAFFADPEGSLAMMRQRQAQLLEQRVQARAAAEEKEEKEDEGS